MLRTGETLIAPKAPEITRQRVNNGSWVHKIAQPGEMNENNGTWVRKRYALRHLLACEMVDAISKRVV